MQNFKVFMLFCCHFFIHGWASEKITTSLDVEVLDQRQHDPSSFTQGLFFVQELLVETTGGYGKSKLLEVDLESGYANREYQLPRELFGEGACFLDGKIYQVTWKSKKGFVYDFESFAVIDSFSINGEGWGLACDVENRRLILSDGSDALTAIDVSSYRLDIPLRVRNGNQEITKINELELVNGYLLANLWQTDKIAVISPNSGKLLEMWDLSQLKNEIPRYERSGMDVLNGIAWDENNQELWVTGKKWSRIFKISVPDSRVFQEPLEKE